VEKKEIEELKIVLRKQEVMRGLPLQNQDQCEIRDLKDEVEKLSSVVRQLLFDFSVRRSPSKN